LSKTAVAVRHVAFEDLDLLAPLLERRGYAIAYRDGWDLAGLDPLAPDLMVVLGGPIGVYEIDAYPFLAEEIAMVAARLAAGRPTLGVCLGAQLMARALGARVYPSGLKEIGWAPIRLTEAGRRSPLAALGDGDAHVLHWHGDTYDLPAGAECLANSDLVEQQAFAVDRHALALQFHIEASARGLERWYIGHTVEIAGAAGVSVAGLRQKTAAHAEACARRGERAIAAWLDGLTSARKR
jgi:GMP synthase (glutamine-hydrolysing)